MLQDLLKLLERLIRQTLFEEQQPDLVPDTRLLGLYAQGLVILEIGHIDVALTEVSISQTLIFPRRHFREFFDRIFLKWHAGLLFFQQLFILPEERLLGIAGRTTPSGKGDDAEENQNSGPKPNARITMTPACLKVRHLSILLACPVRVVNEG